MEQISASDNRTVLMECALRLFSERGYDSVGVQEIVELAKVTKPTLYHYFGNKRGLLEAMAAEYGAKSSLLASEAAAYARNLPLTLDKCAFAIIEFAQSNPPFYRMMLAMYFAPVENEARQVTFGIYQRMHDALESMFLRASADHGNMRGRHRAYAATFLGMVNTYIGLALNNLTQIDNDTVRRAVHQFMHGIFS